eukprot:TRINITY_DN6868_c0_g1_i2.p1 TRINITY_DN6868_c0_g1~~TRINITY_DN6868_c0_g1_i2.p1  ORF type:complete len:1081 (+),score=227.50 TRINITY_DN6868_c0_g1_i2:98-3244(+)
MMTQNNYRLGEVVWAKVSGHPWWPAIIARFDTDKIFVNFIGSNTHAKLPLTKIGKYEENYGRRAGKTRTNLVHAIKSADELAKTQAEHKRNLLPLPIEDSSNEQHQKKQTPSLKPAHSPILHPKGSRVKRRRKGVLKICEEEEEFAKELKANVQEIMQNCTELSTKKLLEHLQDGRVDKIRLSTIVRAELGLLLHKLQEFARADSKLKDIEIAAKNAMRAIKRTAYSEIFECGYKKRLIEEEGKVSLESVASKNLNSLEPNQNMKEMIEGSPRIKKKEFAKRLPILRRLSKRARSKSSARKLGAPAERKKPETLRTIELRTRSIIVADSPSPMQDLSTARGIELRDGKVLEPARSENKAKFYENAEYRKKLEEYAKAMSGASGSESDGEIVPRGEVRKVVKKPAGLGMRLRSSGMHLRGRSAPLIHHTAAKNATRLRRRRKSAFPVAKPRLRKASKKEQDSDISSSSSSESEVDGREESDSEELSESQSEEVSEDEDESMIEEEKFKKESGKPKKQAKNAVTTTPLAVGLRSRRDDEVERMSVDKPKGITAADFYMPYTKLLRNRRVSVVPESRKKIDDKKQKIKRIAMKKRKRKMTPMSVKIESSEEKLKERVVKKKGMELRNQKIVQREKNFNQIAQKEMKCRKSKKGPLDMKLRSSKRIHYKNAYEDEKEVMEDVQPKMELRSKRRSVEKIKNKTSKEEKRRTRTQRPKEASPVEMRLRNAKSYAAQKIVGKEVSAKVNFKIKREKEIGRGMKLRSRLIRRANSEGAVKEKVKSKQRNKQNKKVVAKKKPESVSVKRKHTKPKEDKRKQKEVNKVQPIGIKRKLRSNSNDQPKDTKMKLRSAKRQKAKDTQHAKKVHMRKQRSQSADKVDVGIQNSVMEVSNEINYAKKRNNSRTEEEPENIIAAENLPNKKANAYEPMIIEGNKKNKRTGKRGRKTNNEEELKETDKKRANIRQESNVEENKLMQQNDNSAPQNVQKKKRGRPARRRDGNEEGSGMACGENSDTEVKESQRKDQPEVLLRDPELARSIVEKIAEELLKVPLGCM